jgi:hypothetical protein
MLQLIKSRCVRLRHAKARLTLVKVIQAGQTSARAMAAETTTEDCLSALVQSVGDATSGLQEDVEAYHETLVASLQRERTATADLQARSTTALEEVQAHASASAEAVASTSRQLVEELGQSRHETQNYAQQASSSLSSLAQQGSALSASGGLLVQDAPTGHTPRKRAWPSFDEAEEGPEPPTAQAAPAARKSIASKPVSSSAVRKSASQHGQGFKVLSDKVNVLNAVVVNDVLKGK